MSNIQTRQWGAGLNRTLSQLNTAKVAINSQTAAFLFKKKVKQTNESNGRGYIETQERQAQDVYLGETERLPQPRVACRVREKGEKACGRGKLQDHDGLDGERSNGNSIMKCPVSLAKDVEKIWLSNAEAQRYLGVSADFLKSLRRNAEIHFYKVHNVVFYRKSDIDKLVENNRII